MPFIQELGNRLPISSSLYQIGFVLFGNEGVVEFDFNAASTSGELADALESIQYKSENTNTTGGEQCSTRLRRLLVGYVIETVQLNKVAAAMISEMFNTACCVLQVSAWRASGSC